MMELPILEGHKDVEITYCANCKSVLYKGKYIPLKDFKKAFSKLIRSYVSFSVEPKEFSVDTKILDKIDRKLDVPIYVKAEIDGEEIEEEAIMEIKFKQVECPFCSRLKGGYYEGVLQLRNKNNSMFKEVENRIRKKTDEKKLVAISYEKEVKGGMDFYMTDKKFISNLASELHNEFGGEFKESPRLYSMDRQSSKKVYRLNALLRLPELEVGDIVEWKNSLFSVNGITADKVMAQPVNGGKKRPIKLEEALKKRSKADARKAVVTKTKPNVEVLHPETFASTPVENKVTRPGKKIDVVEISGKLYAV